jgi:hypothetical protein
MWFQRVVEDVDVDVSEKVTDDRSGRTSGKMAGKITCPVTHPGDFQRVKLMMKLTNPDQNPALDILTHSPAGSSFRLSKYEWDAAPDRFHPPIRFLTSTFKNSHYNSAHYSNPNFQPERWDPGSEEAYLESRKTGGPPSS